MKINRDMFRLYDIRGRTGDDLTTDVAEAIGKAFGTYIHRRGGGTIATGRDNRLGKCSSTELQDAFIRGVLSTGIDAIQIGLSTSPLLYFAVAQWSLAGGVNITGSHNPIEYNGFKLTSKLGQPIAGEEIQHIMTAIEEEDFVTGHGRLHEREASSDYFSELNKRFRLERPVTTVVDAGNGVAGLYAPQMLRRIGCEVFELYCDLDGSFPNHLPDPEIEENVAELRRSVVEKRAELGLAFDGDGDRIGLVDEKGERYESDYVLILLARDLLQRHPGAKIMLDVKCSQNVIDDIRAHGGEPFLYKSGHSLIKIKMHEEGILLAGEVSGHMFFGEQYYGFDDAVFAACRIAEILSRSKGPLSAFFESLPKLYTTPELRIKCQCPDERRKFQIVDDVTKFFGSRYDSLQVDGIRIMFHEGWALVRASNTNPYLTVRIEARSPEAFERFKGIVFSKLMEYPELVIPSEYITSSP